MEIYESIQTGLASGATEPVLLADVKSWALIDTDADDTVIGAIIVTAREMVESFISRDLVSKDRIVFIDKPDEPDEDPICLPYDAKTGTLTIEADGVLLVEDDDYEFVGVSGRYINLFSSKIKIKISFESNPITSPSELTLAEDATKVLIEQIYNNRGTVESDIMPDVFNESVKTMLNPIRHMYF